MVRQYDRMTLPEQVGQLLMVDCPTSGPSAATLAAMKEFHVGSVILDGTSTAGVAAIRSLTAELQRRSDGRLLVATDQEGGLVQRLQGPGFSRIPSAVVQGRQQQDALTAEAHGWGDELRSAGIDVDLAPVMDTVPSGTASNPPIGDLDREYGSTPDIVKSQGLAVLRGLAAAGVAATAKHFPGLGRVTGNTDTTAGVSDTVTTATDPYLQPFRAAVDAHVPLVMMSTAIYARIASGTPAAFSSRVVTDILRNRLHFPGVVISDDLGTAAQVADVPVGQRAVKFVAAGGDLVLTVDASQAGAMTHALIQRARTDPDFARLVRAAVLRVLTLKQRFR